MTTKALTKVGEWDETTVVIRVAQLGIGVDPAFLIHGQKNQASQTSNVIQNTTAAGSAAHVAASDLASLTVMAIGSTAGLVGVALPGQASLHTPDTASGLVIQAGLTGASTQSLFLATAGATRLTVLPSGEIGVNTLAPTADFEVAGDIKTTGFQLTTGASNGYVLTSDASGVASWAAIVTGVSIGDTVTGATAGSLLFAGTAGVLAQDNAALFWNDAADRLQVKGALRLYGASSGFVGLAPAAAAGSTTYTLPSADGTNGQILKTNGSGVLDWTSGNALGSTQGSELSGSRSPSTVYQNTTGKPMFLSISSSISNITGTVWLYCDSSPAPTTVVAHDSGAPGFGLMSQHIVPAGYYYKLAPAGSENIVIGKWFEETLDGGSTPLTVTQTATLHASRSIGTVYQNTTGKPMLVAVSCLAPVAGGSVFFHCDAVSAVVSAAAGGQAAPTIMVESAVSSAVASVSHIVPPGYYFKIYTDTAMSVYAWTEETLDGGGGGGSGMAIGYNISGATAGSILVAGTAGTLDQDNANLFWDNPNNRLGVLTNSPITDIHLRKTQNAQTTLFVQNDLTAGGGSAASVVRVGDSTSAGVIAWSATHPYAQLQNAGGVFSDRPGGLVSHVIGTMDFLWTRDNASVLTEFMRLKNSTGNLGVGVSNPTDKITSSGNIQLPRSSLIGSSFTGAAMAVGSSGGAQVIFGSAGATGDLLQFVTHRAGVSHAVRMTIDVDGNVGINTTSPGHLLDVAGNINVSTGSAYKVNGTTVLSGTTLGSGVTASSLTSVGTLTSLTVSGTVTPQARVLGASAAITAANDLTLGSANQNIVSGTTQINAITTTGWTAGSAVSLIFASTVTVKHNTTGGGGTAPIRLAGSADFAASVDSVLKLEYDGAVWQEVSRKAA